MYTDLSVRHLLLGPLLAAALFSAHPALGAQASAISVEQLARTSDAVIRGKVLAARAARRDGRVFTTYDVRTAVTLRGRSPAVAHVRVPGGVVDGMGERVDAAPSLVVGEELILFLRRAPDGAFVVAELAQGKLTVVGAMARPDLSRFVFTTTSVPPGERRSEEMSVAELERRVRSSR